MHPTDEKWLQYQKKQRPNDSMEKLKKELADYAKLVEFAQRVERQSGSAEAAHS